jgi:2-polyprenyl-6-hydroxyphenyl methylase/3-demethylubiquinone-9 3-methyltransferase
MTQFTNTDSEEIKKFDNVAQIWWDPKGEMGTLHIINPLRTKFITENLDMPNCKILDVAVGADSNRSPCKARRAGDWDRSIGSIH